MGHGCWRELNHNTGIGRRTLSGYMCRNDKSSEEHRDRLREQLHLQAQQNIPTDYVNQNYVNIILIVFLYSLQDILRRIDTKMSSDLRVSNFSDCWDLEKYSSTVLL